MELTEAKSLIRHDALSHAGIPAVWADLGCGSGLFTRALAELLPRNSLIYAVDRHIDPNFPTLHHGTRIETRQQDFFLQPLDVSPLDGLLMANSLHFIASQATLLGRLRRLLKKGGSFLLVEYDTEIPINRWNPFPVPFKALHGLFSPLGYHTIEKLQTRLSRFGRQNIYAARIGR